MADRYHDSYWPKAQTCQSCGHTARPVHHDPLPPDKVFCPFCGASVPFETCKPTRGDVMRDMTDGELAMWLSENANCPEGEYEHCPRSQFIKDCLHCWLDWLKQEVIDDG